MVFKGPPNLYVRISNKFIQRATGKKGFSFDTNGKYETESEPLIKLLKQHFEVEETIEKESNVTDDKPAEDKVYQCKKCSFTTNNMGLLMAHYRGHKKEG